MCLGFLVRGCHVFTTGNLQTSGKVVAGSLREGERLSQLIEVQYDYPRNRGGRAAENRSNLFGDSAEQVCQVTGCPDQHSGHSVLSISRRNLLRYKRRILDARFRKARIIYRECSSGDLGLIGTN